MSPLYLVVEGPERTFEASTLSSFREDRHRANTLSPARERERERETKGKNVKKDQKRSHWTTKPETIVRAKNDETKRQK